MCVWVCLNHMQTLLYRGEMRFLSGLVWTSLDQPLCITRRHMYVCTSKEYLLLRAHVSYVCTNMCARVLCMCGLSSFSYFTHKFLWIILSDNILWIYFFFLYNSDDSEFLRLLWIFISFVKNIFYYVKGLTVKQLQPRLQFELLLPSWLCFACLFSGIKIFFRLSFYIHFPNIFREKLQFFASRKQNDAEIMV